MVGFRILADELFFRAFLGELCDFTFNKGHLSVLVSAFLFGIAQLTHAHILFETDGFGKIYWCFVVVMMLGIPYALSYKFARSILPGFVAQCSMFVTVCVLL